MICGALEKMRALGRCGDRTRFELAPDTVTPASDQAVDRIGQEGRNEAEETGKGGPGLGQFAEGGKDGA